jgi:uncharacterized protein
MSTLDINQPIVSTERIGVIDALRGLAIGGILVFNIRFFSGDGLMPSALASHAGTLEQITEFLIHFFIEGKFYSVFSFLFGFGFALQIARAEKGGDSRAALFKRRMFWLLIIGIVHALFLSAGDILTIYAAVGFVLILFRKRSDRSLLKWAFALLAVPVISYAIIYVLYVSFAPAAAATQPDETLIAAEWNGLVDAVSNGNFSQIFSFNLKSIMFRCIGLLYEMRLPKILAMFLFGVCAYRRDLFGDFSANRAFIRRVMVWGFGLGMIGNGVLALLLSMNVSLPPSFLGLIASLAYAVGVPGLAFFYIAAAATIWQKPIWQRCLLIFAPVGRMALTNYLMQSVICVFLFYGYGFGLFGRTSAAATTLIALPIFLFQILLSTLWLKQFRYGPAEWIWRKLAYRGQIALQKTPPESAGANNSLPGSRLINKYDEQIHVGSERKAILKKGELNSAEQ